MNAIIDAIRPFAAEIAVFLLAVVVLMLGLASGSNRGEAQSDVARTSPKPGEGGSGPRSSGRRIGWVAFIGLLVVLALTFGATAGRLLFDGTYVEDGLSLFFKRLVVAAAALSVLGSLTLGQRAFQRRSGEYYFALLTSLLGMMVLASARELILLFVAFELMSIPLFVMSGFLKRDTSASEAALKFFLVGTASSAVGIGSGCRFDLPQD